MSSYFRIDAGRRGAQRARPVQRRRGLQGRQLRGSVSYRFFERCERLGYSAIYTRLIDDAEDSPVVDDVGDENQLFAAALVNYTF